MADVVIINFRASVKSTRRSFDSIPWLATILLSRLLAPRFCYAHARSAPSQLERLFLEIPTPSQLERLFLEILLWPAWPFLTREVVLTSYYRMRVFLTLQVTTAQDAHVMQFVSGNDVSQRANADIILVCLSVSQPLRFI